jgi:AmmeMemoRadiSam system protein A/AmmeMemoRadiSam system protein B
MAGVVCAVLMAHAPVIVPGISDTMRGTIANSCQAMRAAAQSVVAQQPEAVVLISPHSPRHARAFGLWTDDPAHGSFAQFRAPHIKVRLPLDRSLTEAIAAQAKLHSLDTWNIQGQSLDHGALVPLWFLVEAGWNGPTVILSLNDPRAGELGRLGQAIAAAARALPRRIAIVASGDMSHRLTHDAPCGFDPEAHRFDEAFIRLIREGDYRKIEAMPQDLRDLAAEDAVDSTLIAAAACDWQSAGHQLLHYEGPLGVGYGVAVLYSEKSSPPETRPVSPKKAEGADLPALARQSVAATLRGRSETPAKPTTPYLSSAGGVFVTIRHKTGALRGCIGTIEATTPNLVAETWRNARLAALHDPRFPPITSDELDGLRFEVSVLHAPEPITSKADLDPARYGVIVSCKDGRRGLLLPGIPEIGSCEEQLSIAKEKGGIGPNERVTIERFQVDHFDEPDH